MELTEREGITRTSTAAKLAVSARTVFRWRSQMIKPGGVAELQPAVRARVRALVDKLERGVSYEDGAGVARGYLLAISDMEAALRELRERASRTTSRDDEDRWRGVMESEAPPDLGGEHPEE